jgi:hypothetical protein
MKPIGFHNTGFHNTDGTFMKFRIQSRAKSSKVDQTTERVKSKVIIVNEVLEFDHYPTGDEIQIAITSLPKYKSCMMRFLETIVIKRLPE